MTLDIRDNGTEFPKQTFLAFAKNRSPARTDVVLPSQQVWAYIS